jgi:hypothetical protein
MTMTLDEAQNACLYKLGAAWFHYENLVDLCQTQRPTMFEWTKDFRSPTPREMMPIFYHLDAFLYQLVSCFEMLLQVVNIRAGVGLAENRLKWGTGADGATTTPFMKRVKANDPSAFDKIQAFYRSDLFASLKRFRDQIAHRGTRGLYISYVEGQGVTAVSIVGEPYELVDRCNMWGKHVSDMVFDVDIELKQKL